VSDAARLPRWYWAANFLVLFAIMAAGDLGEQARSLAALLIPAALIAWMALLRLSPGTADRIGMGIRRHPGLVPARWRTLIFAVLIAAAFAVDAAGRYATRQLNAAGAPAWAVHHPSLVLALPAAVIFTALAMAAERALRVWPGRRLRRGAQGIRGQGATHLAPRHPPGASPADQPRRRAPVHRRPGQERGRRAQAEPGPRRRRCQRARRLGPQPAVTCRGTAGRGPL
jgi:hypothetical protein